MYPVSSKEVNEISARVAAMSNGAGDKRLKTLCSLFCERASLLGSYLGCKEAALMRSAPAEKAQPTLADAQKPLTEYDLDF